MTKIIIKKKLDITVGCLTFLCYKNVSNIKCLATYLALFHCSLCVNSIGSGG